MIVEPACCSSHFPALVHRLHPAVAQAQLTNRRTAKLILCTFTYIEYLASKQVLTGKWIQLENVVLTMTFINRESRGYQISNISEMCGPSIFCQSWSSLGRCKIPYGRSRTSDKCDDDLAKENFSAVFLYTKTERKCSSNNARTKCEQTTFGTPMVVG